MSSLISSYLTSAPILCIPISSISRLGPINPKSTSFRLWTLSIPHLHSLKGLPVSLRTSNLQAPRSKIMSSRILRTSLPQNPKVLFPGHHLRTLRIDSSPSQSTSSSSTGSKAQPPPHSANPPSRPSHQPPPHTDAQSSASPSSSARDSVYGKDGTTSEMYGNEDVEAAIRAAKVPEPQEMKKGS